MKEAKEELKHFEKAVENILKYEKLSLLDRLRYLDGRSKHYNKQITPYLTIISPEWGGDT